MPDDVERVYQRSLSRILLGGIALWLIWLLGHAIWFEFVDYPDLLQVIRSGTRVDAELLTCHDDWSPTAHEVLWVAYRWTARDGIVRTIPRERIPNIPAYVKVCGGTGPQPATIAILADENHPDLPPVIDAIKDTVSKRQRDLADTTALILAVLLLTLGSLLSIAVPMRRPRER